MRIEEYTGDSPPNVIPKLPVMKFTIARREETTDLSDTVNRHLRKGWYVNGQPFLDRDGWVCQALIKEDHDGGTEGASE